jgi:hypothetical protein
MLPFFLAGAGGDAEAASNAILQLIRDYDPQNGAELDLVVQIINFGAALMDNLRQSTRPGLSDNAILKYRAGAIALERAASRCRKTFAAMQASQPRLSDTAPDITVRSTPMPAATRQEAVPPAKPKAQPAVEPSPHPKQPTQVHAQPTSQSDQPALTPTDEYQFEADIETMRLNALALIASLQAEEEQSASPKSSSASNDPWPRSQQPLDDCSALEAASLPGT